ncbi:cysteine-rich CWC family protein [Conexibacter woesei]|nr:cysteine-rich CWC family protein [Conexibacter woesei]
MELREQSCEACGARFGCGADAGHCWCGEVALDPATLARLRGLYDSCLCPACLQALAARSIAQLAAPRQPASIAVIRASPRGESR